MKSKVGPDGMMDIGCRVHDWMIEPFTRILQEYGYRPTLQRDDSHFVLVIKYKPGCDREARLVIEEATAHCSKNASAYRRMYQQARVQSPLPMHYRC